MTFNSYAYIIILAVVGAAVIGSLLWLWFGRGRW